MIANRKPPGPFKSRFIEWQAGRIPDPVARLRYLKTKTAEGQRKRPRLPSMKSLPIAILLSLAMPVSNVQTGPDARERALIADVTPDRPIPLPAPTPPPKIWRVELKRDQEIYSNSLRIENRFLTSNYPRAYRIFPLGRQADAFPEMRRDPAGIVFHTTESSLAPLESDYNSDLRQIAENALQHARLERAYHFMIDRFGRVFRIVQDTDVAFHAGKSLWADNSGIYIGLNDSFLAVAFEGQTRDISEGAYLSPAQILAGKLLVEMLLDKYHISVSNCITHSQVSINPGIMKIGKHTDGAGDFPFEQLGLPDNYTQPLPSVYMFGFDYDLLYLKSVGHRLWRGLFVAEERVGKDAEACRLSIPVYKASLRGKFRKIAAALEIPGTPEERER